MTAGPTTRRRQLGAEMRRLRAARGMTLEEAGAAVDMSRATVNRLEKNAGPVRWTMVDALCRAYEASDEVREAAVWLAKNAKVQGWWQDQGTTIPDWMTPLLTLEDEAVEECHFATTYVPGLLQTRDYATAVHQATEVRVSDDQISRRVDVRMKRQEILTRTAPPHLWMILDEAVVRRKVGSAAVMADQLTHLLNCAKAPTITIQIMPFDLGAHAAGSTGFVIIRGAESSLDVVYLANLTGALYLEKPGELDRHRVVFEYLRSQALDTVASSAMITEASGRFTAAARKE